MNTDNKKNYKKPQITHNFDLETKAGSPLPPCDIILDQNGKPCS